MSASYDGEVDNLKGQVLTLRASILTLRNEAEKKESKINDLKQEIFNLKLRNMRESNSQPSSGR